MHGAAGLGGVELPPSPAVLDPRPAVVALAELLMTSPEPVTVAAVGPLTNIALLLRVFPDAAARIGRLVVMGGSAARGGNVTAAAEFNVWADAEAAQAVLTSALPTVLVGLDVTLPTVLDEDGIARFAAAGPIGAQAAAILQQYLDHARDRLRHHRRRRPRRAGRHRGDPARHARHGAPRRRRRHRPGLRPGADAGRPADASPRRPPRWRWPSGWTAPPRWSSSSPGWPSLDAAR